MPFQIDDNKRNEANEMIGWCADWNSQGRTAFEDATYEEGIWAALVWMLGQTNEPPKVLPPFMGDPGLSTFEEL